MSDLIYVYSTSLFIVLGFQLAKAESPFIETNCQFWFGVIIACLFAPVTLLLMVGYKLHGNGS